jgi:hypothetical protein
VLFVALPALPAAADPAGPTDYRAEVVGVDPPVEGLHLRVLGGDSFLELEAPPGVEVLVLGYQHEPYLRFAPDGLVQENRRSPTTYLNQDRFGRAAVPVEAAPGADPEWHTVARGGSYAWHDHRTHWMLPQEPHGTRRGEPVLRGAVPLRVADRPVEVTVQVTWLPEPSWIPAGLGALVGAGLGLAAASRRDRRVLAGVALAAAGAASGAAAVAYTSVPAETGPRLAPVALALVAVVLSLAAMLRRRWAAPLVLVASVELILWAVLRRQGLSAAILPTDLPGWLDRSLTAGVGMAALVLALGGVRAGALGPWSSPSRPRRIPSLPA